MVYEWTGRTIEYHRPQIRGHLGFRECSVADPDKLTAWLAEHVACKQRRPEWSVALVAAQTILDFDRIALWGNRPAECRAVAPPSQPGRPEKARGVRGR